MICKKCKTRRHDPRYKVCKFCAGFRSSDSVIEIKIGCSSHLHVNYRNSCFQCTKLTATIDTIPKLIKLPLKIVIPGELTHLNHYIQVERANRYLGAQIKKQETYRVKLSTLKYRQSPPLSTRHRFSFTWFAANQKKDPDNICFARKFILDGLILSGVIKDDGWSVVGSFTDSFAVDSSNPRVEITIVEC